MRLREVAVLGRRLRSAVEEAVLRTNDRKPLLVAVAILLAAAAPASVQLSQQ